MTRILRLLAGLLVCLGVPGVIAAQESRPDILFLTGQATSLESADDGGWGGVEWLHPVGQVWSVSLGGYGFSLGGSEWAYGKLGAGVTLKGRTTIAADASVGAGKHTATDADFTYELLRAEVTYAVVERVLYATFEDLYSDVDAARENLIRIGLTVYPSPTLGLRLNYHRSTGGNVDSNFFSGRVDVTTKWCGLLAGFLVGQTSPERLNLIPQGPGAVQVQEFYVGASVPVGRQEVTVIFDVAEVEGVHKYSAIVVWKIPF